jgi:hypothetical protein
MKRFNASDGLVCPKCGLLGHTIHNPRQMPPRFHIKYVSEEFGNRDERLQIECMRCGYHWYEGTIDNN